MTRLYNVVTSDFLYPDINNLLVFLKITIQSVRTEMFNGNPEAYKLALTLISTVRGILKFIMVQK